MANGEIKPDSKLLMIIILICVEADEDLFVNGNYFHTNTANSKKRSEYLQFYKKITYFYQM